MKELVVAHIDMAHTEPTTYNSLVFINLLAQLTLVFSTFYRK